ncbi:MAG TPA: CHAD domain-containing protein [Ktedonobacteraceae bacterium]|nr:CHAD domain-containing protein [Ktedonobacteraceae bacterium]
MQMQDGPVRAAIDVGSNTIHIVVARCAPTDLAILADEQELVRIGESVTATGEISPRKRDDAIATLTTYKELAARYTNIPPIVVATEAIRRARNSQQFLAAVKRETGLDILIIDGAVEALLTFYGSTYELYQEPHAPALVGVLDLGGGSMELVLANRKRITWHTSVPVGSGWLHDRYLQSDPPSQEDQEVARTFLSTYFTGMPLPEIPPALIATGGSANSLLLLARRALALDEQEMRLTYEQVIRCEALLSDLDAGTISERYEQPFKRARILPSGALIIHALMLRLQLGEIRVSTHGIREGVLLAYARYGDRWLQRVKKKAAGADDDDDAPADESQENQVSEEQGDSFAQTGYRLLLERTHKMLEWREEVLKHEDIEAVHKMRVASRRLRAVLDAYEAACDAKQFRRVYRRVKEIADILGEARDTDVMVEGLQQRLEREAEKARPGIQWLIDRLITYREAHQVKLEAFLRKLDDETLVQQIASLRAKGHTHGKG